MAHTFGTILRSDPVVDQQEKTFGTVLAPAVHPPIPTHFDGREVWADYLSPIKNQGLCGACYAFSVVGMLADRYAIQTLGQAKPDLNPMEMVVCMKDLEDIGTPDDFLKTRTDTVFEKEIGKKHAVHACKGNTMYNAARSTYVQGTLEESCVSERDIARFIAKNGRIPLCLELEGDGFPSLCVDKRNAPRYWMAEQYYTIGHSEITETTVNEIKLEVMKWGPVAVGFQVFDDFLTDYRDGTLIYTHPKRQQKTLGGHAVRIVGWGEDEQDGRLVKYWIIANSWGREWGDGGYGKIEIMIPELQLEQNVVSVWPQIFGSDFPYPLVYNALVPRASDDDDVIRAQLDIDPVTMYANVHVDKIRRGEMSGSLAPVIDTRKLPNYTMFWAYTLGHDPVELQDGTSVYALDDMNMSRWRNIWIWFIVAVILVVLVLFLMYRRRRT